MGVKFSDWLQLELERRDWTQADLSRESGVNSGTINNIVTGKRNVGIDTCNKIAKALKLPSEEVLSVAGLLPQKTLRSLLTERAVELFSRFTEGEQQQILEELDIRLERKGRTKNATQERKVSPRS